MVEEQRVPGVSEALYSLGARGIRGLPLAGALSRRHVCFSVVKRAAGRQTGLNQPLPPPPPPSPPDHPASTSCTLSFSLVLSLSLSSLHACPRCSSLFVPRKPILLRSSDGGSLSLFLRARLARDVHRRTKRESVRWVTNCFLFERTN